MATITKYAFDPDNEESFLATREMLHKEHRLGGSEVGVAAGECGYKCARRMYEEWIGNVKRPDLGEKIAVRDGHILEPIAAQLFEKRSGKKVHRVNAVLVSDEAQHIFASIDRKIENEDSGLEIKTCNARNSEAFADGKLPKNYKRQVKTYMKITGYKRWYVFVWCANTFERCYLFTMDPDEAKPEWVDTVIVVTQDELDECDRIAANFAYCVVNRIPPTTDGSADESEVLKELFPEANDAESIELTKVGLDDVLMIGSIDDEIKALEAKRDAIKNAIKDEMGNHAEATVEGRKITWKNNKASSKTDWKAAAAEAAIPDAIVEKHTTVTPGARVLRISKK